MSIRYRQMIDIHTSQVGDEVRIYDKSTMLQGGTLVLTLVHTKCMHYQWLGKSMTSSIFGRMIVFKPKTCRTDGRVNNHWKSKENYFQNSIFSSITPLHIANFFVYYIRATENCDNLIYSFIQIQQKNVS